MLKKLIQFTGLAAAIFLIIALMITREMFSSAQKSVQNIFYDFDQASPKIVIVGIDEGSLQENALGKLTQWPRSNYSKAIEILNQEGAKAIGLDVLFPDPSTRGTEDDQAFADTLTKNPDVVLAQRFDYTPDGTRFIEGPNDAIMAAKPAVGWINVNQESDGFVRSLPVFAQTKSGTSEAFSLLLARLMMEVKPVDYRVVDGQFQFADGITIPVFTARDKERKQELNLMRINYFAAPKSYQTISFANLLDKKFTDTRGHAVNFKDKIVLIGPTAKGLGDSYISPVSEGVQMPGVEIHANNIQTIISERFLADQSANSVWLTLLALLLANMLIFAFLKVRYALPIALAEMVGMVIAGIYAYGAGLLLNVVHPMIEVLLTFTGVFLLRFIIAQKEKKFVEGAFSHYVSKDVVKQILSDPHMLELGGAKREVTVFFSDIQGSTGIAEKMEPGALVHFLNEYFRAMTDIILGHRGTLDKYEGDAIIAFWNAPVPMANHAEQACLAAIENQSRLRELRKQWAAENKPDVHVRIGLHTGPAIVGNMGSETRFDYTVMGDTPNLGSRLESINKQYGTEIIISDATYAAVKDKFLCRELDQIRVKGKTIPITIYELIAVREAATPEWTKKIQDFAEALSYYRQKNFIAAQSKFAVLANDPPAEAFMRRCTEFMKNPPDAGWDGVYTFTEK